MARGRTERRAGGGSYDPGGQAEGIKGAPDVIRLLDQSESCGLLRSRATELIHRESAPGTIYLKDFITHS